MMHLEYGIFLSRLSFSSKPHRLVLRQAAFGSLMAMSRAISKKVGHFVKGPSASRVQGSNQGLV